MCLFSRFWWKWLFLFLIMLVSDFSGCLFVFVIVLLWWLLLSSELMVFCSICFLLWMMILGVFSLSRCFNWLLWLIMWWYRLFRFDVVKWLLFSGMSGCSFGGSIGSILRIIYLGLMFECWNVLRIFRCFVYFLIFVFEFVFFSLVCSVLICLLMLIVCSSLCMFFVFILVWNLLLYFLILL